jgi:hypothetical protein
MPGGGFTSFTNNGTLTLASFDRFARPIVVRSGSAALGTIEGAGQNLGVFANGAITYGSLDTSSNSGSGGAVTLYSSQLSAGPVAEFNLSASISNVDGGGSGNNITTNASGAGATAGSIAVIAPQGTFATANGALSAAGLSGASGGSAFAFGAFGIVVAPNASATAITTSAATGAAGDVSVFAPSGSINVSNGINASAGGANAAADKCLHSRG